jgi:hypothetical protein
MNTASWYLHDKVFTACQMRYQESVTTQSRPNIKNDAGQVLIAHHSKWNFLIKAFNGKRECHVAFRAEMTYSNGSFNVNWWPGLF